MGAELLELSLSEVGDVRIGDGRNAIDGNQFAEAGLSSSAEFVLVGLPTPPSNIPVAAAEVCVHGG